MGPIFGKTSQKIMQICLGFAPKEPEPYLVWMILPVTQFYFPFGVSINLECQSIIIGMDDIVCQSPNPIFYGYNVLNLLSYHSLLVWKKLFAMPMK